MIRILPLIIFICIFSSTAQSFEEGSIADSINQFGQGIGGLNRSIKDMNQNLKNIRKEIAGCGDACAQQTLDRYQRLLYEYDMYRLIIWQTKVALFINKENMYNETTKYCTDEYMGWYNCYDSGAFFQQQAQAAIGVIPDCKASYEQYITECRNPLDMFVNGYPMSKVEGKQSPYLNDYGEAVTTIEPAVFDEAGGVIEVITPISTNTLRHIKKLFPVVEDYNSLKYYVLAHLDGHKILRCLYPQQKELWYWYKSAPDFGPLTAKIKNTRYHPAIVITESQNACPSSPSEADFTKNSYYQTVQRSKVYIAGLLKKEKEKSDAYKFYLKHGQKVAEYKEEKIEARLTPRDREFLREAGDDRTGIEYKELDKLVSAGVKYLECRYVQGGTFRFLLSDQPLNILTQHKLLTSYRIANPLNKCPDGSKEAESLKADYVKTVKVGAHKTWKKNEVEADAAWKKKRELMSNPIEIDVPFDELNVIYTPSLVYPVDAIFPEALTGHVEMTLSIDTAGQVSRVEVIDAQPPEVFNKAARKAARGLRFDPVTKGSDPAWGKTNYTIYFNEKNRTEYILNSTTVKMKTAKFNSLKKALKKAGVAASINKKTYKSLKKQQLAYCQYSLGKKRIRKIPYWYLEVPNSIDVTSVFPDQEYFKGLRGGAIKQCPSQW